MFNITQSAGWAIAASVISARNGLPFLASFSNTWVAHTTG